MGRGGCVFPRSAGLGGRWDGTNRSPGHSGEKPRTLPPSLPFSPTTNGHNLGRLCATVPTKTFIFREIIHLSVSHLWP